MYECMYDVSMYGCMYESMYVCVHMLLCYNHHIFLNTHFVILMHLVQITNSTILLFVCFRSPVVYFQVSG